MRIVDSVLLTVGQWRDYLAFHSAGVTMLNSAALRMFSICLTISSVASPQLLLDCSDFVWLKCVRQFAHTSFNDQINTGTSHVIEGQPICIYYRRFFWWRATLNETSTVTIACILYHWSRPVPSWRPFAHRISEQCLRNDASQGR